MDTQRVLISDVGKGYWKGKKKGKGKGWMSRFIKPIWEYFVGNNILVQVWDYFECPYVMSRIKVSFDDDYYESAQYGASCSQHHITLAPVTEANLFPPKNKPCPPEDVIPRDQLASAKQVCCHDNELRSVVPLITLIRDSRRLQVSSC